MATNLRGFKRVPVEPSGLRRAAVALVVVRAVRCGVAAGDGTDEAAFLLTRRAPGLRTHAGQWALPGGRLDDGEDAVSAARREVAEELGIGVSAADVLGVLDDFPTRSGYVITPVVCWSPDSDQVTANVDEVESVRVVPLAELDHPDSPSFEAIPESEQPIIRMRLVDRWINAPTAAILYQFREAALHGRSTRAAHYEQPVWAWK